MDESRKLDDPATARNQWRKEAGSVEDLGATGVFGAPSKAEVKVDGGPGNGLGADGSGIGHGSPTADAFPSLLPSALERLQEPVVHKVSLPAGSATQFAQSLDILERLRSGSPARESAPIKPFTSVPPVPAATSGEAPTSLFTPFTSVPSPAAGGAPGEAAVGFTQLLRSLGGDASVAPRPELPAPGQHAANPETRSVGMGTGFTALLRSLNPETVSDKSQTSVAPPPASPQPSEGGFTALLQGIDGPRPAEKFAPTQSPPDPARPSSIAAPGAFTQLINTFTSQANHPNPAVASRTPSAVPGPQPAQVPPPIPRPATPDSFTQIMARIERPLDGPPPLAHQNLTGDASRSKVPSDTDYWKRPTDPLGPANSTSYGQPKDLAAGVGLDTVIMKLSGQSYAAEDSRFASASSPAPAQDASFTSVYHRLDQPVEAPLAPAPQPSSPSLQPYIAAVPMPQTPHLASQVQISHAAMVPQPANPSVQAFVPSAPTMPPPPTAATPPMGRMQQYLPLLLIIIIFLLIVILVMMGFLMKR